MFLHPIYLVPTYQTCVEEKMMGGGDCLTYGKYLNLKQNEGKAEATVAGVKQATDFVYNIDIFSHFVVVYEACTPKLC